MLRGLIFLGVGTATALYFLDEKKGKKRRAKFKKQFDYAMNVTGERLNEYSREIGSRASVWSQEFKDRAPDYLKEARVATASLMKNGTGRWSASPRLIGALGSAIAFYGAGRPGFSGTLLRTLSLGVFTRALMAAR